MKYDNPEDVPQSVVDDIKKKRTYVRIARSRANSLGIELGELPDSEWRDIWWKRAKRRSDYYQSKKMEEAQEEASTIAPVAANEERSDLADYLAYYTDPAPNDLIGLRQLVSMQKQLDNIDLLIADTLNPEEGDINAGKYKTLIGIQKQLSTEMRLLQDNLGISRRIRDQQRSESELADHLRANIRQARELLDELGTKLICPYCRAEKGVEILQGFLIHHFPEMGVTVTSRCPDCSREYKVETPPRRWERRHVLLQHAEE